MDETWKHFNRQDIDALDKVYRLNLINSITGYKPANLIGTKSINGEENVAIFSSIVHLGSNPPLVGFIMRPATVPRNTLDNIKDTKFYTVNHVNSDIAKRAHYTSAKFPKTVSEFEACGLTTEYNDNFHAPFVGESAVKFGLKFIEEIPIKHNGTFIIVGEIMEIYLHEKVLTKTGLLDLNEGDSLAISGLNKYHKGKEIEEFPYARLSELPNFSE